MTERHPHRHDGRQASIAVARHPEWRESLVRYFPAVILLAVALILAGCASLSEDECTVADWQMIGAEDGARGLALSRLAAHRKACAKAGVTPDAEAYKRGRQEGLVSFCTYDRGYGEGRRGASQRNVCPAGELRDEFLDGYDAGRRIYEVNQQIRGLESQLAEVRAERDDVEASLESNYYIDETGKERQLTTLERRLLFDKLRDLNNEEAQLQNQIGGLRASISGS